MFEQLNAALGTLEEAADGYLRTCQVIYDQCVARQPINTIPRHLATSLSHQLSRMESLREKFKRAERVVNRFVNASSSLVSIHALPPEILTRIFELAQGDGCIDRCSNQPPMLLVLTTTCYYWRQLTLNSPARWTHIDVSVRVNNSIFSQIEHAKLYAERAGHTFLHIHIIDRTFESEVHDTFCALLAPFIGSIAPRIRSFICHVHDLSLEAYGLVFNELFKKCTPRTLQVLDIYTEFKFGEGPSYWDTHTDSHEDSCLVDTSFERLDDIYMGIDVLRLCSIFPRWTSSAYRGLVELRLKGYTIKCAESQLIGALRQSPGLRVFECGMSPASPLALGVSVNPIPLADLEVVNLGSNLMPDIEAIVRWLAPGPKPLQLLVRAPSLFKLGSNLLAFINRSNITMAYIVANSLGDALHLASHLPHLQSLALADTRPNYNLGDYDNDELVRGGPETLPGAVKAMYVIGFDFGEQPVCDEWPTLELLQRVIFYRCAYGSDAIFDLSIRHPRAAIEIVPEEDRSPVADWEVFAPYDLTMTTRY